MLSPACKFCRVLWYRNTKHRNISISSLGYDMITKNDGNISYCLKNIHNSKQVQYHRNILQINHVLQSKLQFTTVITYCCKIVRWRLLDSWTNRHNVPVTSLVHDTRTHLKQTNNTNMLFNTSWWSASEQDKILLPSKSASTTQKTYKSQLWSAIYHNTYMHVHKQSHHYKLQLQRLNKITTEQHRCDHPNNFHLLHKATRSANAD